MDRRNRNSNPNEHYSQAKKNVKEWKVSAKTSRCCVVTQYGRTQCLEEGEYEDDQDSFEDCKPTIKKTLFVKNNERRRRSRSNGRSSYNNSNNRSYPYVSSKHHYWRRRRLNRERKHYHRYNRRRTCVDEVVEVRERKRDDLSSEKRTTSSNNRKAAVEVPSTATKRRQHHKNYDNESCDTDQSEYNKASTNKRTKKSDSRVRSSGKIIKVADALHSGRSSTSSQEIQNKHSHMRMEKFETIFDESDSNTLSETPSQYSTPRYDSETHGSGDWLLQRDSLTEELCQRRQTLYEIKNLEKQAKKLKTELALLDEMFNREQKTRRRSKRRLKKMSKKEKKVDATAIAYEKKTDCMVVPI